MGLGVAEPLVLNSVNGGKLKVFLSVISLLKYLYLNGPPPGSRKVCGDFPMSSRSLTAKSQTKQGFLRVGTESGLHSDSHIATVYQKFILLVPQVEPNCRHQKAGNNPKSKKNDKTAEQPGSLKSPVCSSALGQASKFPQTSNCRLCL